MEAADRDAHAHRERIQHTEMQHKAQGIRRSWGVDDSFEQPALIKGSGRPTFFQKWRWGLFELSNNIASGKMIFSDVFPEGFAPDLRAPRDYRAPSNVKGGQSLACSVFSY